MLKICYNIYHHYKYGKIVHRGADGTVIRKKLEYTFGYLNRKSHLKTTKTVINPYHQVEKQLNRRTYIDGENNIHTTFDTVTYRPVDGQVYKKTKGIYYTINKDSKHIADYNAAPADYSITELPDGHKKYEIYYPRVTNIVKGGPVTTETPVKTVIV